MTYEPENFSSIAELCRMQNGGLSVLGFLYVLKDVLGGREGTIDLNALASSLGITMNRLYGFIGVLEDSFIIRTTATPEGRRIEFLGQAEKERETGFDFPDDWLKSHSIAVNHTADNPEINPSAYKTAVYIGEHFEQVKKFYSALKSTLNDRREMSFSLDDIPSKDINAINTLAKGLHTAGFLSAYEYHRKPSPAITAKLADTSEAHRFISGHWLELWTHSTGKYSGFLEKYSRIAKLLGLSPEHALLVSATAPVSDTTDTFGITCCSLEDFPEVFARACT